MKLALLAITALLILAACNGIDPTPTPTAAAAPTGTPTPTSTASPIPTAAATAKKSVSLGEWAVAFCTDEFLTEADFETTDITWAQFTEGMERHIEAVSALEPPEEVTEYHYAMLAALEALDDMASAQDPEALVNPFLFLVDPAFFPMMMVVASIEEQLPPSVRADLIEYECITEDNLLEDESLGYAPLDEGTPLSAAPMEIYSVSGSGDAVEPVDLAAGVYIVDMYVTGNEVCQLDTCTDELFDVEIQSVDAGFLVLLAVEYSTDWKGSEVLRVGNDDWLDDLAPGRQLLSVEAVGSWDITFTRQ